jgi:surfeit locus 1 family protein
LIVAAGFVMLGRWQLDRAEVNRAIEHRFTEAVNMPVLDSPVTADRIDELRYRLIALSGHYRADVQILLDNMTLDGQPGYQVLTPLVVAPGEPWVLVNRGWLAAPPDRSLLPDVTLRGGVGEVAGRIDHLPRAALDLEGQPDDRGGVIVMSFPDAGAIGAALGHPVSPFQVLLDPQSASGFVREWGPEAARSDRNLAYAVQWFGLALLAFVCAAGVAWRSARSAA